MEGIRVRGLLSLKRLLGLFDFLVHLTLGEKAHFKSKILPFFCPYPERSCKMID